MEKLTEEQLIDLFILWFNDFLSIQSFADYIGHTEEDAKEIIKQGRRLNERKTQGHIYEKQGSASND